MKEHVTNLASISKSTFQASSMNTGRVQYLKKTHRCRRFIHDNNVRLAQEAIQNTSADLATYLARVILTPLP